MVSICGRCLRDISVISHASYCPDYKEPNQMQKPCPKCGNNMAFSMYGFRCTECTEPIEAPDDVEPVARFTNKDNFDIVLRNCGAAGWLGLFIDEFGAELYRTGKHWQSSKDALTMVQLWMAGK